MAINEVYYIVNRKCSGHVQSKPYIWYLLCMCMIEVGCLNLLKASFSWVFLKKEYNPLYSYVVHIPDSISNTRVSLGHSGEEVLKVND